MTQIHTYHCLCAQLLLATPYALSTLPQRQPPALDAARILPLRKPPISENVEEMPVPEERLDAQEGDEENPSSAHSSTALPEVRYSLLLNTTLDRRAVVVRREDGFEKRWVRRCGRCRTGVGYVLSGKLQEGEGMGVVYLLEEGFVETEALRTGRGKEGAGGEEGTAS